MFRSLLIANRGEIALRIARTARTLGVRTVVAHSEADRGAPWLDEADEAVCIGPAPALASYLDQDAVLQAAEQCECQAVHPGYGFLAENAVFAARCEQQGLTFVGPTAGAIARMGDKAAAKRAMEEVGLPTIPGSNGVLAGLEAARTCAEEIGYPVLLKASAGGGGKGMRRCDGPRELERAYREASQEAEKAFGNPALYLERLVTGARHIEFQALCDAHGSGIHLGERECSIQRKHQKLVEESPSPALDAATRDAFGGKVAAAVAALGYRNAGTVEFLYDREGRFYFMEMNARLQVEHPVTESITGVDLVAEQLRLAANRPLELAQADLSFDGYAVEFRINAEDPARDFAPGPGTITAFTAPRAVDGVRVRWDSAVREGYRIPPYYDSMIGKLILHGADRKATLSAAPAVLRSIVVGGVPTTVPFHLQLLADPSFLHGEYDTAYLERRAESGSGGG